MKTDTVPTEKKAKIPKPEATTVERGVIDMGSMPMAKDRGVIRWFNNKKGYGFIQKQSDGEDIFVHFSGIEMDGYKSLKTNDKVEFIIEAGEKGPQAAKVRVLEST